MKLKSHLKHYFAVFSGGCMRETPTNDLPAYRILQPFVRWYFIHPLSKLNTCQAVQVSYLWKYHRFHRHVRTIFVGFSDEGQALYTKTLSLCTETTSVSKTLYSHDK
jgi:hypothetical protein